MTESVLNLDTLSLASGGHRNFAEGACLLEAASFLAGEPWSDHPKCVSRVLGAYGRRLNDRLSDEDRQKLIPFIPALLNTADDGQDTARSFIAADWAIRTATPRWLDAAGLTERAAELRALPRIVDAKTARAAEGSARQARAEAWAARTKSRETLKERIREELAKRGVPADAAAVAAAVADAVAAAVAVADADADYSYGSDAYWKIRDAVYDAIYKKTRAAVEDRFAPVIEANNREAIALLGRMIDPSAESAIDAS